MFLLTKFKKLYVNNFDFKNKEEITKLSGWSKFLIVILNIFAFTVIVTGLSFQLDIVNNPNTKYNNKCVSLLNYPNRITNYDDHNYFSNNLGYYNRTYKKSMSRETLNDIRYKELDSRCKIIFEKINKIKVDNELISIKSQIKNIEKSLNKERKDLNYIQSNYNTLLFEKMANQTQIKSIMKMDLNTKNAKTKYQKIKLNISIYENDINSLKNKFKDSEKVNNLKNYILSINKETLKDYKSDKKNYYLKRYLIALLFLLPINILFYWRMKVNNLKNNYTRYIIVKNLFLTSIIPLLYFIFKIVVKLIPQTFIEKFIMFFYNINIPFIVYYILLGIGIGIITLIILKIQNKKSKELKYKNTNINFKNAYRLNTCVQCSTKVNYETMNFCPNCKNEIKINCTKCNKMTLNNFNNCSNCGNNLK